MQVKNNTQFLKIWKLFSTFFLKTFTFFFTKTTIACTSQATHIHKNKMLKKCWHEYFMYFINKFIRQIQGYIFFNIYDWQPHLVNSSENAIAQILLQYFHGQNVITISYTKNNKNNNTKICVFRLLARLRIRPARVSSQNSYQCFAFPQFSIPQYLIKYPPLINPFC